MTTPKYLNAGSSGEWGWHATELALRCPQLFAYSHRIPGLKFDDDRSALIRGSLVHQGLAHHYARLQNEQAGLDPDEWMTPEDAIDRCAVELASENPNARMDGFVRGAKNVLADYLAHWPHERLEVLFVEEVFAMEVDGRKFTQRFDLVARMPDGRVWIFDHKTTGRIDHKVPQRYVLSGQFLGMATFGRRIWGAEFGGVRLNLIGCGAASVVAAPGSCTFSREAVDPAPHALRLFPLSVKHARDRIEALDASGLDPWEWPKALSEQTCITAYGRCSGYELCRWGGQ